MLAKRSIFSYLQTRLYFASVSSLNARNNASSPTSLDINIDPTSLRMYDQEMEGNLLSSLYD